MLIIFNSNIYIIKYINIYYFYNYVFKYAKCVRHYDAIKYSIYYKMILLK